ncbi:class I SAM-dependent methyltransferase [Thiocapsa rosea]|uniref:Methyltransferase family protein n=1 Tax=Thiocapsa rosea TaxID=69360 RepID=A0A495ULA2_9GAMM|nr:methyltransferase family protein [Thiocapsa rosea]
MTSMLTDDPTLAYYEDQAKSFFAETVDVDMAPLYARFLARVTPGGHILDAGCGSGRDALAFRRLGYAVTAFEASPALALLASEHCGLPVEVRRFQEIDWEDAFDGIWACASLLHIPMVELPEVLGRLGRALKAGGVLYASFKYGAGEREHGGRRFTDLDEMGLAALVEAVPALAVIETWITGDRREGREGERWLNAVVAMGSATHAVPGMSGHPHESSGPGEWDLKTRIAASQATAPSAGFAHDWSIKSGGYQQELG